MNIIAFILAIVALVIFICTHFGVPRRWATLSLGLAFLTAALMAHFILAVSPVVRID